MRLPQLLPFFSLLFIALTSLAQPPNIVILLADDLGWADVGFHADRMKTPHLDALAKGGAELDRFYVCPMCTPTRAATLTGRYPIRFGLARAVIPPWRDYGLDTTEVTMAKALREVGYAHRGIFGKWHLGHAEKKWLPNARGFTEFRGHYNGAIDYFSLEREGERDWHHNGQPSNQTGYATDLIADAAAAFIQKHAGEEAPYFCYVPFNAPHSPFQAPEEYLKAVTNKSNKVEQTLAAMIHCMDDGIGRILTAVKESGEEDNTMVWFFSDNGGVKKVKSNNRPLRGDKLSAFEGGIRVPACVRWPAGGIPAGSKVTVPLSCMDIFPTVLHLSGVEESAGKPFDGVDVFDVIAGTRKQLERPLFFYHGQSGEEVSAIITGKWKLVIEKGPDLRDGFVKAHQHFLFAIQKDPNEKKDLAKKHPEVVAELAGKLVAWRKLQVANPVPVYGGGKGAFKAPKLWQVRE